ncbi:MAG: hypothetical protein PVJ67_03240 [Candidatus Pacearchaeota archaeon]|jgi:hypothetical protein
MFGWFFGKKEAEKIKEETKKGFESVKKDFVSFSEWIKHLDSEKNLHKSDIDRLKENLSTMKKDLEELKEIVMEVNNFGNKQMFKTTERLSKKQTPVYAVQTPVQTVVQTPNLDQFSITEKAIIWILLNSDMKLSYDDLAAMLGKEKSTIRGQINAIKQKSEGFIQEDIENNGKKRVYIHENHKEKMIKKRKVRVKKQDKEKKKEKDVENA